MSPAKASLALLVCGLALACRTPARVGSAWEVLRVAGPLGRVAALQGGGATRMACEPPAMEQECNFLAALETVRCYPLEASELRLYDEGGAERLRVTRAADPAFVT